ncbi:hypothetical protein GF382_03690 [Candidatus Falkowbacteria bacterium]|nr:hypothetical protein [Candidatus Falkowbacteria bacterium]
MIFFIDILSVLAISAVFILIARKFHFSEVIGLIAAGVFLSILPLKDVFLRSDREYLEVLSSVGLYTLMFLSGFEVSWSMLAKQRKNSVILTLSTMVVSLILGFVVLRLLGFSTAASLIMGICFGITAEATKAKVLIELKKIKSKLGSLLIDSGIINDIIGVLALVFISYFFANNFSLNEVWNLVGIIFSFLLGIMAHIFFDRHNFKMKMLEKILFYTIVPFFFVNIGLNFNIFDFVFDYKLFIFIFLASASGQILGVLLIKKLINIDLKQAWLVGWGMNSKGAVELAIAYVAYRAGIIPSSLYSILVAVALISTIIFQIIIFKMVRKNPRVMN